MSATMLWFMIGTVCILIEVALVPGIGFLFAGFAAITLGGLLTYGFISAPELLDQIAYFFGFTAVWWVVLWTPLKRITKNKVGESYENLIGTEAQVQDERDLTAGKVGFVKWSGTKMRARIDPNSTTERITNGETVYIHGQKDGVLLVDKARP